jgi:hypothetical protein
VALHDPLAQGQTDPGSRVAVTGVEALEELEDPLPILGLDTDPVVAYAELPAILNLSCLDLDPRSVLARELDAVANEVLEELNELPCITQNTWQAAGRHRRTRLFDGYFEVR